MARCWTCGSSYAGGFAHALTCPLCKGERELVKIRKIAESSAVVSLDSSVELIGLDGLSEQLDQISGQMEQVAEGLANVASVLEWGFDEVNWRLDQLSDVLSSVDRTLKSPGVTKAREMRQIAEELRRRGVFDKSQKFFLESLEANPLDYQTYVGLGKLYLELGDSEKARTYWRESLPHAPRRGDVDYKSYSLRLLGRLYFCDGEFQLARAALQNAVALSPNYYLARYDCAQYSALAGDREGSLESLRFIVVRRPTMLSLIKREQNLHDVESDITAYLCREDVQAEIRFRKLWSEAGLSDPLVDDLISKLAETMNARPSHSLSGDQMEACIRSILMEIVGMERYSHDKGLDKPCHSVTYPVDGIVYWPQVTKPVKITVDSAREDQYGRAVFAKTFTFSL